jgi:hypothetical protein
MVLIKEQRPFTFTCPRVGMQDIEYGGGDLMLLASCTLWLGKIRLFPRK